MFEATKERLLPAQREAVAVYATDPANDLAWIGGTRWVRVLTEGPVELGGRVERKAAFFGWSVRYMLEVIEDEPGCRMVMRTVAGPVRMTVCYEFEDADGGTVMRISVTGEPGRFNRLACLVLTVVARLKLARDLRTLEDRLLGW